MTAVRRRFARALTLLAFAVLAPNAFGAAWDAPKDGLIPIPPLSSAVTDLTGTLPAGERQALEAKLRDWQARTSNQLAVLIIPSTAPEAIEQYSIRVADAWKIGQKGQDNGAILLIAKEDKRMRIEVGYGLEGVLTDVTSRRIIAENIAPEFAKGNFAGGINAGVDRIIAVVGAGEPLPAVAQRRPAPRRGFDFGTMMLVLLVAAPVLGGILRSIFGKLGGSVVGGGVLGAVAWFIASSLLIAGLAAVAGFVIMLFTGFAGRGGPGIFIPGSGGGFGGGFGGGGGGGFSGGGGGFGGGGASGGW
ncbi:MAG: TPM domain-containing protein [Casimicrobiaceae bacterium]